MHKITLFILILLMAAGTGFSQEEKLSYAQQNQLKYLESKKELVGQRLDQFGKAWSKFKAIYDRYQKYVNKPEKMYGPYNSNDIAVQDKKPNIRLRLNLIETRDNEGYEIVYSREVLASFSGDKVSDYEVVIDRYRVQLDGERERRILRINPGDLEKVTAERSKKFDSRKFEVGDKLLEPMVRAKILEKVAKVTYTAIKKLETLTMAYQRRFKLESADQDIEFSDFQTIIR